jgi:hypothetical protein
VQTAFSINNVSSNSQNVGESNEGPAAVDLSVSFDIFNQGPNHIAGIYFTTDSWFTWEIVHAQFVQFIDNNGESWSASATVDPEVNIFEFVVFCDDLGGVESVPRIWNTNGGSVFQQAAP